MDRNSTSARCLRPPVSGSFFIAAITLLRLGHDQCVFLWLMDDDVVWQRHLGSHLALWVMRKHDLDPHTEHTLAHENVTRCCADVVPLRLTCGDEVSIAEL